MEKYKKYFDFSGTISGTNYFLRNLITTFVGFLGGYLTGYGIGSDNVGLVTTGIVVMAPSIWMSVATIYKRVNALFSENVSVITAVMIVTQVVSQYFEGTPTGGFLSLGLLIFGLYLIFKNSNITDHVG